MSRDGSVTLMLGGEDRFFRFGLAEHERLQEALDMGVSVIVQGLHPYVSAMRAGLHLSQVLDAGMVGDIRPNQIRTVILNGLIGGGEAPNVAAKLVATWVDARPPFENAGLAYAIGLAALIGADDEGAADEGAADEDAAGELKGEDANRSPEENSGSAVAASTPSARRRASRPTK